MDALFEIKMKVELEDCRALVKFFSRKKRIALWVAEVISVLEVLLCLLSCNYKWLLWFVPIAVIVPFWNTIYWKKVPQVQYESQKYFYDKEQTIKFYENKLVRQSEISRIEMDYSDLGKFYETKTHFFIMQSNALAICVRKVLCTEEMCEFIRRVGKANGGYVFSKK